MLQSEQLPHKNCCHLTTKTITKRIHAQSLLHSLFTIDSSYKYLPVPKPRYFSFDPRKSRNYIDEAEKWEFLHETSALLCKDCHLTLVPHLKSIFKQLLDHANYYYKQTNQFNCKQSKIDEIALNFLDNRTTLYIKDFIHDIFKYPKIVQYIFKHEDIYSSWLDFWLIFLHFIFYSKCFIDNLDNNSVIFGQNLLSMVGCHCGSMNCGLVFWKKCHFDYVCNVNDINKSKLSLTKFLFFDGILRMKTHCVNKRETLSPVTSVHTDILILAINVSHFYYNYNSKENNYRTQKQIANKQKQRYQLFTRHMIFLLFFDKVSKRKWNLIFYGKSMKWLEKNYLLQGQYYRLISPTLLSVIDKNKCKIEWKKERLRLIKRYKKRNFVCSSPVCNGHKYQFEQRKIDLGNKKNFPKINGDNIRKINTFYVCGGCLIAMYCSRKCQKIHWNVYNHKQQCTAIGVSRFNH